MLLEMSLKMSSITILGSSGSKSPTSGSSAFLLNDVHVMDAGNLLIPLEEKSADIETIWLTHSHLDHISDIAYILDNYYEKRTKTLKLCGLKETLETIKKHFLNNKIWPDFSNIAIYNSKDMTLKYEVIEIGKRYPISEHETIEAFNTDHTVPSCGYIISKDNNSLLISADTYTLDNVIDIVNSNNSISTLVIECSFPSSMFSLAKKSKHLTPELLFKRLKPLEEKGLKLYVNHMKPSYENIIKEEIESLKGFWNVSILKDDDKIYF